MRTSGETPRLVQIQYMGWRACPCRYVRLQADADPCICGTAQHGAVQQHPKGRDASGTGTDAAYSARKTAGWIWKTTLR